MTRQGPTVSVLLSTDLGEMKMPEPMMVPTMIQMPLTRPTWDVQEGEELMPSPQRSQAPDASPQHALMARAAGSTSRQHIQARPPVLSLC